MILATPLFAAGLALLPAPDATPSSSPMVLSTAGGASAGSETPAEEPAPPPPTPLVASTAGKPVAAAEPTEVVVTASRSERLLSETPVAVEVVTRQQIEASGARDLASLLEEIPGLEVFSSFGGSGVRMQGLDPQYVLFLVDGQRMTGRVGGLIDLSRIPVEEIERVEIVKGATSALYGSDALAGVIHVVTRRTSAPLQGNVRATGGTRGILDVEAGGGARRNALASRVSAGFRAADSYDLEPSTPATTGSGFREGHVAGALEWRPETPMRGAELTLDYLQRDLRGVEEAAGGALFDRTNRTETVGATLSGKRELGSTASLRASIHHGLFRDQFLNDQRGSSALDVLEETREQLWQMNAQSDAALGGHLVSVGIDALEERLQADRLDHAGARSRAAIYAQDEWRLLEEPRLVLVPGARIDHDSQFGTHPSPKVSARFDPHERLVLRAGYGAGFRAPGFRELLLRFENPGAGYVVEGNPDLGPERSWSGNAGFEWRAARAFTLTTNVFQNDVEDLIGFVLAEEGSPAIYRYANISSVRTRGIESTVRARPFDGVVLDLGYALTDTEDGYDGTPLAGRALHRFSADLRWSHPGLGLDASIRGSRFGERPFYEDADGDGEIERVNAPAYTTVDARIAKSVLRGRMSVFLVGENLLDEGDPVYLPLPPRTFSGGISARYGAP